MAYVGQSYCNAFDAIGARSFAPDACSYNPIQAVHHMIAVIGGIILLEEFLRRLGARKSE